MQLSHDYAARAPVSRPVTRMECAKEGHRRAGDDCVTVVDLSGNIGFSGPDAFASVPGKPWASQCPGQAQPRAHAAMEQALIGVSSQLAEICHDDKGQPYLWQADISPMVSREGRIVSVLARSRILRDLPTTA